MKIAMVSRRDLLENPGGDTVQIIQTRDELVKLGYDVSIARDLIDIDKCDMIHIFNMQQPYFALDTIRYAKEKGKPVALSPIWWDLSYSKLVERFPYSSNSMSLAFQSDLFRYPLRFLESKKFDVIREILSMSDVILPNSAEEWKIIEQTFSVQMLQERFIIVPNAINNSNFSFINVPRSGIISVGRIEPTKNQLRLIEAVPEGVQLTLIGREGKNRQYALRVRQAIERRRFIWLDQHLSHDELAGIVKDNYIHALPSFRESPGLSSLEALSLGLNLVVSDKRFCPIETYFNAFANHVSICNPFSITSIRTALNDALNKPLSTHQLNVERFSWQEAAKKTSVAYSRFML